MIITLIGYRGSGKTTVGALLAQRLSWNFLDLDQEIERLSGRTVAEIFKNYGEPHFRYLESGALNSALARAQTVVSPGGGIVLDGENRHAMKAAGPVFWLSAPVSTIVKRLSEDPATQSLRPALTGTNPLSEVENVLNSRLAHYQNAATHIIDTENRTPASIVDEIYLLLPDHFVR